MGLCVLRLPQLEACCLIFIPSVSSYPQCFSFCDGHTLTGSRDSAASCPSPHDVESIEADTEAEPMLLRELERGRCSPVPSVSLSWQDTRSCGRWVGSD